MGKKVDAKVDGIDVIMDDRMAVLRSTGEADLLKKARSAKKYLKK